MDSPGRSSSQLAEFHADLAKIHRFLGTYENVIRRLRRGPAFRSMLDIGCGNDELLGRVGQEFGITQLTGIDLQPSAGAIPILVADATRDALPQADVAVSLLLLHHLNDEDAVALIRNVGRAVKRFVIVDLVRDRTPLVLFTLFLYPQVHRTAAEDGQQSIRRAFRPLELRQLVERAIEGQSATFEHWISPIGARQIVEIFWK